MATNYLDMLDAVRGYYGAGSDQWASIAQYGVTDQNWQYLTQVPGVNVTISESGKYLGYDYINPFPATQSPGAIVDSNVETGLYGNGSFNAPVPSTAIVDQQTGQITSWTSGVRSVSTGNVIASIADGVSLAVAGVALGTKAGALIDGFLYSRYPEFWDEHFPEINPLTWADTIFEDDETGKWVFRTIFGLPDDTSQKMQMYMDERLLAYEYAMLLDAGVWSVSGITVDVDDPTGLSQSTLDFFPVPGADINTLVWSGEGQGSGGIVGEVNVALQSLTATAPVNSFIYRYDDGRIFVFSASSQPFSGTYKSWWGRYAHDSNFSASSPKTVNGKTVYYTSSAMDSYYGTDYSNASWIPYSDFAGRNEREIAYVLVYGTITETSGVEGINPNNPEAGIHITPSNVINQTTGQPVTPQDSIDDILQALKLAYPDLFLNEVYEDVVQPDGTIDRITYTPVPYPDMEDPTEPTTDTTPGVDPQTNPEYDPETRPEDQTQGLTDSVTENPTTPNTGTGTTPPFVPPTGTANALYAIYNPSQSELNSFGAWLWSSNFVDQLLKLFNDPMQAIIGLHKVFVNPVISGRQNIKVGYLDSGVASNVVGAQYVTVDCGSVTIPEYFGNVFDYDPFTQIYLYLPFVGIQRLDTGDVMRGTLNVVYHCDVLTGACLVEVNVFRDGGGGIIYTYTGNCAVQYPISSGSYMGIIASLASVVGGVVGTIATGGALAPVALGAVSGVMNAHTRVEHSGGFSGNAGAMGIKKPYVIITRPQTCLADNFPAFNGYPANKLTYIGDCTGYIKCDECHIEQVPGTDAELSELENLLKSGIII